jgi:hypothetical protein
MRVPWRTGLGRASRASQASGRTRAVRRREVLRPTLFVNASFRANGFRCSSRACKAASCATRATCAVTCPFSACDGRATCATTSVRVVRDGASRNKLARRSRKRRSRSRRTARHGERRSMPPHARGRERAILTRFRLVAFTSCPFQTGAVRANGAIPEDKFRGRASQPRKRKRENASALLTSNAHHHHQTLSFITHTHIKHASLTHSLHRHLRELPPHIQRYARSRSDARRVRTRPTTRRRRTRRRRTTARPFIPANSAP